MDYGINWSLIGNNYVTDYITDCATENYITNIATCNKFTSILKLSRRANWKQVAGDVIITVR